MRTSITLIVALISISSCYSQTAEEYFNRGNDKYDLSDDRGAIADFTKAIELKPDYSSAYFNRGFTKHGLQDYRGAIADFTKVIELKPDYSSAYKMRGFSKIKLGQKDSGCLDFSKAGELGYAEAYEAIKKYCN